MHKNCREKAHVDALNKFVDGLLFDDANRGDKDNGVVAEFEQEGGFTIRFYNDETLIKFVEMAT